MEDFPTTTICLSSDEETINPSSEKKESTRQEPGGSSLSEPLFIIDVPIKINKTLSARSLNDISKSTYKSNKLLANSSCLLSCSQTDYEKSSNILCKEINTEISELDCTLNNINGTVENPI